MDKAGEVLEGHLEQTGGSSPEWALLTAATRWLGLEGKLGNLRGARPRACGWLPADKERVSALKAGGPQQVAN